MRPTPRGVRAGGDYCRTLPPRGTSGGCPWGEFPCNREIWSIRGFEHGFLRVSSIRYPAIPVPRNREFISLNREFFRRNRELNPTNRENNERCITAMPSAEISLVGGYDTFMAKSDPFAARVGATGHFCSLTRSSRRRVLMNDRRLTTIPARACRAREESGTQLQMWPVWQRRGGAFPADRMLESSYGSGGRISSSNR